MTTTIAKDGDDNTTATTTKGRKGRKERKEGRKEGRKDGRKEGRKEGRKVVSNGLYERLEVGCSCADFMKCVVNKCFLAQQHRCCDRLAQLDKACAYGARDWGFESLVGHFLFCFLVACCVDEVFTGFEIF